MRDPAAARHASAPPDPYFNRRIKWHRSNYHTIYGIGYGKGKHPIPNVIEAGAQWLHDSYIGGGSTQKW